MHLSRACILTCQNSQTLWEAFMKIWVLLYPGTPFELWMDQAKEKLSTYFKAVITALGGYLVPVSIGHDDLNLSSITMIPLLHIRKRLRCSFPNVVLDVLLDYANIALSHTIRREGPTPAILALKPQLFLPIKNYEQQPQPLIPCMDLASVTRVRWKPSTQNYTHELHSNTILQMKVHLASFSGTRVLSIFRKVLQISCLFSKFIRTLVQKC